MADLPPGVPELLQAIQNMGAGPGRGTRKVNSFSSGKPSDWLVWKRQLRTVIAINGWGDLRSRQEAQASLTGEAGRLVRDIDHDPAVADGAPAFTLDRLLEQYEAKFMPRAESDLAIAAFDVAVQEPQESPILWSTRITELFERAYPNVVADASRVLINRFICGLRDQPVAQYVHEQHPATMVQAGEFAQRKTASRLFLSSNWSGSGGGRGRAGQGGQGHGVGALGVDGIACYKCGDPTHYKRDCPKNNNKAPAGNKTVQVKRRSDGRFASRKATTNQAMNHIEEENYDDGADHDYLEVEEDDEDSAPGHPNESGQDSGSPEDDQGNFAARL